MTTSWSTITFDALPSRYANGEPLQALLMSTGDGLIFQLATRVQEGKEAQSELPTAKAFELALISGTRRYEVETDDDVFSGATGAGGWWHYRGLWTLPWPDDPLADTWLAVKVDDKTFVLELPYGVCRDEAGPIPPTTATTVAPPAGELRRWVRLSFVELRIGDWRCLVDAMPEAQGSLEIQLSKDDIRASAPPGIEVTVAPIGVATIPFQSQRAEGWRLQEDPRVRRLFARFPMPQYNGTRHYAVVTIASGAVTLALVIPSSLLAR